ncbi:MAG: tRNA (adenosine(37)-N6)-threonylcarbamoyltransferase complex ATPase subunit type 1 TsaE [Oscillospiraceae bacterium]|nr:tRNA (adenosine(37)-N6)-threonylcarbamoyltransferase complex ATPase subunit type 1 TsaE [Oscillospiraceae bacterium]
MKTYHSNSVHETERIARALVKDLAPGDVVAFRGGLGAGKTAFTRGLAEGIGIPAGEVTSPTFTLVNEYRGGDIILYHFDMYRVNGFDALYSTGFFDYLDGGGILAIEWSENISSELPKNAVTVTMLPTGENSRRIIIEGSGRF